MPYDWHEKFNLYDCGTLEKIKAGWKQENVGDGIEKIAINII